jgi:hypothetical protein
MDPDFVTINLGPSQATSAHVTRVAVLVNAGKIEEVSAGVYELVDTLDAGEKEVLLAALDIQGVFV